MKIPQGLDADQYARLIHKQIFLYAVIISAPLQNHTSHPACTQLLAWKAVYNTVTTSIKVFLLIQNQQSAQRYREVQVWFPRLAVALSFVEAANLLLRFASLSVQPAGFLRNNVGGL